MPFRDADDLSSVDPPAWPDILSMAQSGGATILPVDPAQSRSVLENLQVTTRSSLGALAYNCGGIVADHGWFRLYGGGSGDLPDLATANEMGRPTDPFESPGFLEVGHDALGGRFAIDGGALGVARGEVCYFGPDTLTWDSIGGGHWSFVAAALCGDLSKAFESLRWRDWPREVGPLALNQGISLYPPPFSKEGQDLNTVRRKVVPIDELFTFHQLCGEQLDD